jgi:integrase
MTKTQTPPVELDRLPLQPQRWKYVLALILERHNWRHSTKSKGVSHATMEERRQFCFRIFSFLRDNPVTCFKLDPRSFSGRHVDLLMADWRQRAERGELGAATLQKNHSFLTTFAGWIGKPKLVKPLSAYFADPALITRSYIAISPKGWRDRGVNVDQVLSKVERHDLHAAASLRLMQAFGLRFKEACMLRPHADVLTAVQAGQAGCDTALYLFTHRGTKGGRKRYVPIDTDARLQAIKLAQGLVIGENDSISDPQLTLVQAIRHLRYVMERFGVTKKALGVVPHGLRHQYAADEYQDATGSAAPVNGGQPVDRVVDMAARQAIAERLGHGRTQIVNAYLGSSSTPPRPAHEPDDATPSNQSAQACIICRRSGK